MAKKGKSDMILSWFDAAEAKKFGESLARFFIASMPAGAHVGEKAFEQKAVKVLGQMAGQVAQFKQAHKLNTYKKAQLGNAFTWTLKDANISPEYSDKLTEWLMLHVG